MDLVYQFLFDATKCFSCPLQPKSGRPLFHKKNKRERPLPRNGGYKVIVIILTIIIILKME